jgi:hypothetical protein
VESIQFHPVGPWWIGAVLGDIQFVSVHIVMVRQEPLECQVESGVVAPEGGLIINRASSGGHGRPAYDKLTFLVRQWSANCHSICVIERPEGMFIINRASKRAIGDRGGDRKVCL